MSEKDKKLLVYLGAVIILAVAYFFVGRPYLDKIDQLTTEREQLEHTLAQKVSAYQKQADYEQGIADAKIEMQDILDKFPENNTDEKSIMFISEAESEVAIWFNQVKFAEEVRMMVNSTEQTVDSVESAEQIIAEQQVQNQQNNNTGAYKPILTNMYWYKADLGLSFQTKYDSFKDYLAYIRDYEDRMIIKEMELSYDELSGMVNGSMVLSQYALLGEGRELLPVETNVKTLGTNNIFTNEDHGGSILDLLADAASDFINKLMGGTTEAMEAVRDEFGTDYFIRLNAATDIINGKTIGRGDDISGSTHIVSSDNSKEDIVFNVEGENGKYTVKYSIGNNATNDTITKEPDGKIYLRIISSERLGNDDKVTAAIHINNNADIPVYVNIDNEDSSNPRANIVEKNGLVTVE